jgi:hypothetical protein
MMQRILILSVLALFILTLPLVAFASRRSDIEDALDYWTDYADDEGYVVLDSDIDTLDEDEPSVYYTIDLEAGEYVIVAESGEEIENLDMAVYYEDDYEDGDDSFVEDTYDDNFPICEFELDDDETIVVELWVEDFARHEDNGYYCILFTMQD